VLIAVALPWRKSVVAGTRAIINNK
jgi:hypothetical protein